MYISRVLGQSIHFNWILFSSNSHKFLSSFKLILPDSSVLAGSMQKSLTKWSQLRINGISVACMEDWYTVFNGGIR